MPTLTSGDTLSLNNLAGATAIGTQNSNVSLGAQADNGTPSAGDNISLSSFAVDSMDSISGFTYGVEGTSETYEAVFSGAGTNFLEIKQNGNNFTWTRTAGSTIATTPSGAPNYLASFEFLDNGTNASQTSRNTVTSNTISVVWADGYNDHLGTADGYNKTTSPISKTVYCVDSYDGHSSALCLTADSPIILVDGTIVDAGDLEEGDILRGYSLSGLSDDEYSSNFLEWSTSELGEVMKNVEVVNLTYSFASRYYNVNNGEITGTAEHPMLVKDSSDGLYKFKELHNLIVGDKLIKQNGGDLIEVNVDSIEATDSTVEIVSIDVESQDTYLVNGYITHNKGTNTWTDFAGPSAPTITYNDPGGAQNSNLSWTTPTATGTTGVTEYELQVDDNSDFSSLDATHSGTYSTTSLNVSGLSTGTWYARVRAKEMGVYGAWSSTLTFSHTFEN